MKKELKAVEIVLCAMILALSIWLTTDGGTKRKDWESTHIETGTVVYAEHEARNVRSKSFVWEQRAFCHNIRKEKSIYPFR